MIMQRPFLILMAGIIAATTVDQMYHIPQADRLAGAVDLKSASITLLDYSASMIATGTLIALIRTFWAKSLRGTVVAATAGLIYGLIHILFFPAEYREVQIYLNILYLPLASLAYYWFVIGTIKSLRSEL